jgi:hypothetical protein
MTTRLAVLTAFALIAAAGTLLGSGKRKSQSTAAGPAVAVSTTTAAAPAARVRRGILFYSDLGPEEIDVSSYPDDQRRNYAVFVWACSRCHGLARSINAPYVSRGWWEFYMTNMRLRGRVAGRPFSREETKAVLDFLDYDSRVRKVEKAAAFEKAAAELKRRFAAYVDQRMGDLQKESPRRLLPSEPPR